MALTGGNEWKINRHFDYESVNFYYINKIAAFPTKEILSLPTTIPITIHELGEHLKLVASDLDIALPKCDPSDMYLWGAYLMEQPTEKHKNIWKYREYIFGCAMLFIAQEIETAQKSNKDFILLADGGKARIIPSQFKIEEHSFTIVGSSELTSDIDITVQGPHASLIISLVEDLFNILTITENIPIRCWDVEFYGDFRLLDSVFVNFHKFTNLERTILLKYAIVSYFRSTHQVSNKTPNIHPNVEFLIYTCLKSVGIQDDKLNSVYNELVKGAYNFWRQTAPLGKLDREFFYRQLFTVESDSSTIIMIKNSMGVAVSNNETMSASGISVKDLAFTLFSAMAQGNIHRAESYVLPSTAVHVVEFEQKKVGKSTLGLPVSWFSNNARIGIDPFGFLLSAIEQLGYLEHYHPEGEVCSKKGIKYFGRYVRALIQAGLLLETDTFTGIYKELNIYRATKNLAVKCNYNIHTLLADILATLSGVRSGGARRKTRKTRGGNKLRKHRSSHRRRRFW